MKAISIRVEHVKASRYSGQRAHDLRDGHIPDYVSRDRIDENSLLVCPPPVDLLRDMNARAAARAGRRAPNRDAAVAAAGVLTFGVEAQSVLNGLSRREQDERIARSVRAVAEHFKTEVVGLVVHRDESAVHAHFMFRAICDDGRSFSSKCTRKALSQMQEVAATAFADLDITRGKRKIDRIRDGEPRDRWVHKTVAELHRDLPADLEKKRVELERVDGKLAASERKLAEVIRKLESGEGELEKLLKLKKRYETEIARFQKAAQRKVSLEPPRKGLLGYRSDDVEDFVERAERAVSAAAAAAAVASLDRERAALAERERAVEQRESALSRAAREWQEVQQRQQAALAERERAVEQRESALAERERRLDGLIDERATRKFSELRSALVDQERSLAKDAARVAERERAVLEEKRAVEQRRRQLDAEAEQLARARLEQLKQSLKSVEHDLTLRQSALLQREKELDAKERRVIDFEWTVVQRKLQLDSRESALSERQRDLELRERKVQRRSERIDDEVQEMFERQKPGLLAKAYADLELSFESRVAKAAEERAAQMLDREFDRRVRESAERLARDIVSREKRRARESQYDIER